MVVLMGRKGCIFSLTNEYIGLFSYSHCTMWARVAHSKNNPLIIPPLTITGWL